MLFKSLFLLPIDGRETMYDILAIRNEQRTAEPAAGTTQVPLVVLVRFSLLKKPHSVALKNRPNQVCDATGLV